MKQNSSESLKLAGPASWCTPLNPDWICVNSGQHSEHEPHGTREKARKSQQTSEWQSQGARGEILCVKVLRDWSEASAENPTLCWGIWRSSLETWQSHFTQMPGIWIWVGKGANKRGNAQRNGANSCLFGRKQKQKMDSINTDLINTQQETKGGIQKGRRETMESTCHVNLLRENRFSTRVQPKLHVCECVSRICILCAYLYMSAYSCVCVLMCAYSYVCIPVCKLLWECVFIFLGTHLK